MLHALVVGGSTSNFICIVSCRHFQEECLLWRILETFILYSFSIGYGARGSIGGWGTMLQARRSRVLFLMRSLDFSIDLIPSSRTMALGSTQPLTEMSTRNLPGGKGRPVSSPGRPARSYTGSSNKLYLNLTGYDATYPKNIVPWLFYEV
jgi:hypothetical protein